ncbi:hypothetical protein Scep_028517 [Stephania cephalantha]|uniref:Uncharacterized protein n=1 Tax=Stephania cephalantha TaxID=152367 RepID=A0AAP0EC77_9MAGN
MQGRSLRVRNYNNFEMLAFLRVFSTVSMINSSLPLFRISWQKAASILALEILPTFSLQKTLKAPSSKSQRRWFSRQRRPARGLWRQSGDDDGFRGSDEERSTAATKTGERRWGKDKPEAADALSRRDEERRTAAGGCTAGEGRGRGSDDQRVFHGSDEERRTAARAAQPPAAEGQGRRPWFPTRQRTPTTKGGGCTGRDGSWHHLRLTRRPLAATAEAPTPADGSDFRVWEADFGERETQR